MIYLIATTGYSATKSITIATNVNEEVVIEETIKPEKVTKTKKVREANVSENKTHKSVKKNVKKDE